MDLKEVRAKKPDELTEDEKTFLAEHKTELTDDERTTFGLVDEPATLAVPAEPAAPAPAEPAQAEPADPQGGQQASAGAHGLTAAQIAQLQADAAAGREAQQTLLRTSLTASVETAIARGAIKSDQLEPTVELLMASDSHRDQLPAFIAALPDHPAMAPEASDGGTDSNTSAQDELNTKAAKLVADSGGQLTYSAAVEGAMKADSSLRDRVAAERSGNH